METQHKTELKERMEREKRKWVAQVINAEQGNTVIATFDSTNHTFENVLHKVELDLMTNLHNGFVNAIMVRIKEAKKEVKH